MQMKEYKELKEFEIHLMKKNRSKKTIINYINDCRYLLNYLNKPTNEISSDDLLVYKYYMLNELELEISSINRKCIAINQLFKLLKIDAHIIHEKVHFQSFLTNLLTDEDIDKMIAIAESKRDYRFIAILNTLKITGARVSECLQIKLSDISLDSIVINGKGSKRRTIFISNKLKIHWNTYVKYRKNTSDKLFTGIRGSLTPSGVDKLIKKYGKMANIEKEKLHAHNFRHYCALKLISVVDLTVVAMILGHNDINTTAIYTRRSKEQLLQVINDL